MPSIRVEESIEILRGIEAVFDELADPRTWVREESGLRIHGPRNLREGTQFRTELELNGEIHESEASVTVYERPTRFGMRALAHPFNFDGLATLTGDNEQTRLTVEFELEPSRWIFGVGIGLGRRFVTPSIEKVVRHKLAELKIEMERAG